MKICTKLLSIQCILKVQGFTVISYPQNSKCCKSAGFSGKISCKISKFPAGNARIPAGKITPLVIKRVLNFEAESFLPREKTVLPQIETK